MSCATRSALHSGRRLWMLIAVIATSGAAGYQQAPASQESPGTPTAIFNSVPTLLTDPLDLLVGGTTVVADGELFAIFEGGRLTLGSLSRGRVFETMPDLDTFGLNASRGLVLRHINGTANDGLDVFDLRDQRVERRLAIKNPNVLTPTPQRNLMAVFSGSQYDDGSSTDYVALIDLSDFRVRKLPTGCKRTARDEVWGQRAQFSTDGRALAVTGPCEDTERVAVYIGRNRRHCLVP